MSEASPPEQASPADHVVTDLSRERTKEHQRAFRWYDWANSAFVTTTGTVLFAPYLTEIARAAACADVPAGVECVEEVSVLGIPIAVGSLAPYTITLATILSAIVLLFVGAIADRHPRPTRLLGGFAWVGAAAASAMVFLTGTNWQLGVLLMVIATICLGSSTVVYDALLIRVSDEDERDKVSANAWAFGYLGGGILLLVNLVILQFADSLGIDQGTAVRICLLSAGLWWGLFTIIPVYGLRRIRGVVVAPDAAHRDTGERTGAVRGSVRQLGHTLRDLRHYPVTLTFLLAYLFYNDGIQTVIASASLYGTQELGFAQSQMLITILVVQFVAFGGAWLFGRVAATQGAKRTVFVGILLWTGVVAFAYVVPAGAFTVWLVCGVLIGLVMGGTQALSRSMYSQLIPRGKESEYFSLYQMMERGTSWFGTLLFGLVYQFGGSYRYAIISVLIFFVIGAILLSRVDMRRGIREAGNPMPRVV